MSEDGMVENNQGGNGENFGSPPDRFRGDKEPKGPKDNFIKLQRKLERDWDRLVPDERNDLMNRRQILIDNADKEGLFEDARVAISDMLRKTQWDDVYSNSLIYRENLEKSARRFYADNPEWEGMVETVVEGAIAKTRLGGVHRKLRLGPRPLGDWPQRHGYDRPTLDRIAQEADLKYIVDIAGDHPELLVGINLPKEQRNNQQRNAEVEALRDEVQRLREVTRGIQQNPQGQQNLAQQLREAMGYLPPADNLRAYLEAEEYMVGFNIGPGNEPRFFPYLDHETQDEWKARGTLTRLAAYKKSVPSFDKIFPNQDAIDMSKAELRSLLEKREVFMATALYTHIIKNDLDPIKILLGKNDIDPNSQDSVQSQIENDPIILRNIQEKVMAGGMNQRDSEEYITDFVGRIKNCPESIFEIKDGGQLKGLRAAMRYWLMVNRGSVLNFRNEIPLDEARDQEQISWLLVYSSGIIEDNDSRFTKVGKKHGRLLPIAGLKCLPLWMMMHPQERLEAKVNGSIPEEFGAFGAWALNKKHKIVSFFTRWTPKRMDILPKRLFGNIFEAVEKVKIKVDRNREKEVTLEEALDDTGQALANFAAAVVDPPNFNGLSEAPFSGYQFDTLSPATLVFKVIVSGAQNDKNVVDLGNACRKLGISHKYRDRLLMAWIGITSTAGSIKPTMGWGDYKDFKRHLKNYAPNYFK